MRGISIGAAAVLALALATGGAYAQTQSGTGSGTTQQPMTHSGGTMQHSGSAMGKTKSTGMARKASAKSHEMDDRATKALNLLVANGYTTFDSFTADGRNFRARATKNGQMENVVIDPDAGTVTAAG